MSDCSDLKLYIVKCMEMNTHLFGINKSNDICEIYKTFFELYCKKKKI